MNQDQVKELLIRLEDPVEEFSVIFSGKKSRKVDGLYYPQSAEIIIHNRNMDRDDELIYTAIHEYAHHLAAVAGNRSSRAHTREYWAIFHRLLEKAETQGLYRNPLRGDPDLRALAERLKSEFLQREGERMRAFGALLLEAFELCSERRYSFEDFVDRELGLHRSVAATLIEGYRQNVPADLGYDNMKRLMRIKDGAERDAAAAELRSGHSPDMVLHRFTSSPRDEKDEKERLLDEKRRIERSLERLRARLDEIEQRLESEA